MIRRFAHLAASLWLVATSLAPGAGWSLCFESTGGVAIELSSPLATAGGEPGASACASECPPERCEECRDVSLDTPDRACPRREVVASHVVAITVTELSLGEIPAAAPLEPLLAPLSGAVSPPHLVRVLRC